MKRIALSLVLAVFIVFLAACDALAPSPTPTQTSNVAGLRPLIIDTDMASEDWIAVLYLLKNPDFNVLAITIAGTGETHCEPGVRNAMKLTQLAGKPDIPVACGSETPLDGDSVFPDAWRDGADSLMGLQLADNPAALYVGSAPVLLTESISTASEPVSLVTLGPLTNVAEALQAKPEIIDNLYNIYMMGGAVEAPGNLAEGIPDTENTTAEWNFYIDPAAARIVLESGAPVTLVSLDATNDVPMTREFYDTLGDYRTTPVAEFVYQVLTASLEFMETLYFWDTLTATIAADATLASYETHNLRVVVGESDQSGRTMTRADGMPVQVAVDPKKDVFESELLLMLNRP